MEVIKLADDESGGVVAEAGKTLSKRAADDVYAKVVPAIKELLARARVKFYFNFDEYSALCAQLLYFNTIASKDTPVYLDDIYVPLTLQRQNDVSVIVDDDFTLESESNAVIRGLAGQGKSTILKKLLSNTIDKTTRTPIFFELKSFKGENLFDDIAAFFNRRGVRARSEDIAVLSEKSDTIFFLDAFDEVPPRFRATLLDQIETLSKKPCRLICTTRPDTELGSLQLKTFIVKELNEEQINKIIKKTAVDLDKARDLIEALSRSKLHKSSDGSVLKTPILVALLCVSYNLGEDIPETLSQFYKNIFDTVFFKHDNLKGRVKRERVWNDDRGIYLSIFEYFSFASQRKDQNSFDRSTVIARLGDAIKYNNKDNVSVEIIFDEICNITNLIFEDGYNTYRYAHRSIQEYFAASFCSGLKEDKKIEFYQALNSDHSLHSTFNGVLFFLKEIDYFSYSENYLVPQISHLLDLRENELNGDLEVPDSLVDLFCENVYLKGVVRKVRTRGNNGGIEKVFDGFFIEGNERFSVAATQLFEFAINNFCNKDLYKRQFYGMVKEHGVYDGGKYKVSISRYNKHCDAFGEIHANSILKIAALTRFGKEYNRALSDIKNRASHLKSDDIFNFST